MRRRNSNGFWDWLTTTPNALMLGIAIGTVLQGHIKRTPRKVCQFCGEDHGDFGLCRREEDRKKAQEYWQAQKDRDPIENPDSVDWSVP